MFWMQTALHGLVAVTLFAFYWPGPNMTARDMTWGTILWKCDPIGNVLYIAGSTGCLLALNWSSGLYEWSEPRVYATLVVGILLLIAFGVYGQSPSSQV